MSDCIFLSNTLLLTWPIIMNLAHLCGRFIDLVWNPSPLVFISIKSSICANAERLTCCVLIKTIQRKHHCLYELITLHYNFNKFFSIVSIPKKIKMQTNCQYSSSATCPYLSSPLWCFIATDINNFRVTFYMTLVASG